MKRLIITCFVFSTLFFLIGQESQAVCSSCQGQQVATPSGINQVIFSQKFQSALDSFRENRETWRQELQIRQATRAAGLEERKKIRIRSFFGTMVNRLQSRISRLEILKGKIEDRLETFELSNPEADTSEIHTKLEDAEVKLSGAGTTLGEVSNSLEDFLNTDNPKQAFQDIKEVILVIRDELISVQQSLVEVIGDIKGLHVGGN